MGIHGHRKPTRLAKQDRPDVPSSIVAYAVKKARTGTRTYTVYIELGYGGKKNCRQDPCDDPPSKESAGRAMAVDSATTARRRRRADVGTTTMAQWWLIGTVLRMTTRPRPCRKTLQIGAVQKPSASRSCDLLIQMHQL